MKTRLAPVVGKVQMAAFWNLPKSAQHWPCTKGSLTQKIKQNVKQFSVQLIHQKKVYLKIAGTHKTECYWERQVVLWGDGQALVEATTHIKAAYCRKYWPFFDSLGTKSLGSQLFVDPKIKKDLASGQNCEAAKIVGKHLGLILLKNKLLLEAKIQLAKFSVVFK